MNGYRIRTEIILQKCSALYVFDLLQKKERYCVSFADTKVEIPEVKCFLVS